MIVLNTEGFSDEFKDTAPKECAIYLSSCLSEDTHKQLKKDWDELGGINAMPYWEYVLNSLSIKYDGKYNERQEEQSADDASNAYTYRAKEINWRTSAKDEEKQYVTGNIVTVNGRYFIVNPEIVTDCGLTGLSFDSGFTEIDKDTIEPVIKPVIDKKKEVLIKVHSELTDLSDATTNKELKALCEACNYDYDTLREWDKECKVYISGNTEYSNFTRALVESNYIDNALLDYAKKYKEFFIGKDSSEEIDEIDR